MSLSDAYVRVSCDSEFGCPENEEIALTALAGRGNYDMRNVTRAIDRSGWVTRGDRHYCESCALEEAELGKADV